MSPRHTIMRYDPARQARLVHRVGGEVLAEATTIERRKTS